MGRGGAQADIIYQEAPGRMREPGKWNCRARVTDRGKYSAQNRGYSKKLSLQRTATQSARLSDKEPTERAEKISHPRTPGKPSRAWLLVSTTLHMPSFGESWRHAEEKVWVPVFNPFSTPSLQQRMRGPQVECLLASMCSSCTNKCNEHHRFFGSHSGSATPFFKGAPILKYFCSPHSFCLTT